MLDGIGQLLTWTTCCGPSAGCKARFNFPSLNSYLQSIPSGLQMQEIGIVEALQGISIPQAVHLFSCSSDPDATLLRGQESLQLTLTRSADEH